MPPDFRPPSDVGFGSRVGSRSGKVPSSRGSAGLSRGRSRGALKSGGSRSRGGLLSRGVELPPITHQQPGETDLLIIEDESLRRTLPRTPYGAPSSLSLQASTIRWGLS